jgi:hypothetical protein
VVIVTGNELQIITGIKGREILVCMATGYGMKIMTSLRGPG